MLSAIIFYWPLYVLVLSVCYINVVALDADEDEDEEVGGGGDFRLSLSSWFLNLALVPSSLCRVPRCSGALCRNGEVMVLPLHHLLIALIIPHRMMYHSSSCL